MPPPTIAIDGWVPVARAGLGSASAAVPAAAPARNFRRDDSGAARSSRSSAMGMPVRREAQASRASCRMD